MAIFPQSPGLLYAGTGAGVFKSSNGGSSWFAASSGLPAGSIYGMAIHPTDPNIVYSVLSGGVYKTTDGGTTWNSANTGKLILYLLSPTLPLVLDPTAPETLYYAHAFMLYKTTNSGANWASISIPAISASPMLTVSQTTPTSLYYTGGSSIYKSSNGGSSWSQVMNSSIVAGSSFSAIGATVGDPSRLYAGLAVQPDAFVAKLDPTGSYLQFSTYLGGYSPDVAYGIATDPAGNSYVGGYTISTNFPSTS
jgi:hypothetical protein